MLRKTSTEILNEKLSSVTSKNKANNVKEIKKDIMDKNKVKPKTRSTTKVIETKVKDISKGKPVIAPKTRRDNKAVKDNISNVKAKSRVIKPHNTDKRKETTVKSASKAKVIKAKNTTKSTDNRKNVKDNSKVIKEPKSKENTKTIKSVEKPKKDTLKLISEEALEAEIEELLTKYEKLNKTDEEKVQEILYTVDKDDKKKK